MLFLLSLNDFAHTAVGHSHQVKTTAEPLNPATVDIIDFCRSDTLRIPYFFYSRGRRSAESRYQFGLDGFIEDIDGNPINAVLRDVPLIVESAGACLRGQHDVLILHERMEFAWSPCHLPLEFEPAGLHDIIVDTQLARPSEEVWIVVVALKPTLEAVTLPGFLWLLAGGVAYTVGAVLYVKGKKRKWFHTVFHVFVVLGSALQAVCILNYVL